MTKYCSGCKKEKSIEEFGRLKRSPDGTHTQCRSCCTSYFRSYRVRNNSRLKAQEMEYRRSNLELFNSRSRSWRLAHPERQKNSEINYRRNNPAKRKESCLRYRQKNPENGKLYQALWAQSHKAELAVRSSARRAMKLLATPPWADFKAITEIYKKAQRLTEETGVVHEVDHYYPLKGKNSCGLHIPANLQIILSSENRRKINIAPEQFYKEFE